LQLTVADGQGSTDKCFHESPGQKDSSRYKWRSTSSGMGVIR